MRHRYVHGYERAEGRRLHDQARTLEALLHHDTAFPAGSAVLEAGCGVGAQTVPLIQGSPGARMTCVDISASSLAEAKARVVAAGLPVPVFRQADVRSLPFADASFDHAFVCFVLEHLSDPEVALAELRRMLRPGGTLTVVEGDHGSALFHPDDAAARAAVWCQVELQRASGGDANIGRRLRPLLVGAGLHAVQVSPRLVYVDASRPELVEGFIRRTFTAMVAGVRDEAIRVGLAQAAAFDAGIRALLRTTEPDGVFCYTFFKAVGLRA
jgi:SAM-dependent methyltransferase